MSDSEKCNGNCDAEKTEREILQNAWENARDIIKNEGDLLNHRTTAFLSLQGFLFAAFGLLLSRLTSDNKDYHLYIYLFLFIVSWLGFVSPRLVSPGLRAAIRQARATQEWWDKFKIDKEYRKSHPFPSIIALRANSYNLFFPLFITEDPNRIDQDDPYDELGLSDAAINRINNPYKIGLHHLPENMRKVWAPVLALLLIFGVYNFVKNCSSSNNINKTAITLIEEAETKGAGKQRMELLYEGEIESLNDLQRRIKSIPAPTK
ncbi:MAG: hypothetical protein ACU837_02500 [Gammaproteobacteria bacterium]